MRIADPTLVTGGAGCIGSDLAGELLRRGHPVRVIDNLSSGRWEHLEPMLGHPRFEFIEGDLLDPAAVDRAVDGVGMVFHLAANSEVKFTPDQPIDRDLRQNTVATHNLLDAMRRAGVLKLAFSSTSAIYGVSPIQPIPESRAGLPISLYGATKLACEALISAFTHLFGFQCWIFRFANIVGPKVRNKGRTVVGDFIARLSDDPGRLTILGDGRQAKSYMTSRDCVSAMLHVVDRADTPLNVYNLGCEDALAVTRIAEMVVDQMGLRDVAYTFTGGEGGWPGDVPRFQLDVSRLQALGWRASCNSEEAVRESIGGSLAALHHAVWHHGSTIHSHEAKIDTPSDISRAHDALPVGGRAREAQEPGHR